MVKIISSSPPDSGTAVGGAEAAVSVAPIELTIVVPTRNEAGNVDALLDRILQATSGIAAEVVFVDDSTDDTPDVIRRSGEDFPLEITLIARPPERRNGLGKAVVEGLKVAQADWVCVMDGDLQHPPEVIPQLLDHALATGANLVAASRLTKGGSTDGLSFRRKLVSYGLALMNRIVFPKRLRQISDPLTGFFLVRRDALDLEGLRPEGFKILLEILVHCTALRVSEVPFVFAERNAGESKANTGEALRLFRQMARLYLQSQRHFLRFVLVGLTGLIVNNGIMALLVEMAGLHYLFAAVLSTQGSTGWNFAWTEGWVYRDRPQPRRSMWGRLLSFFAMNNAALLLRGPLLALFVSVFGMHYLVGNLLSLVVMMLARFVISDRMIWRKRDDRTSLETAAAYAVTQAITHDKE